jgi:hypothetical protein
MNKFIQAVRDLDIAKTKQLLTDEPKWRTWAKPDGKNALHFVCAVPVVPIVNVPASELGPADHAKAATSLEIVKLLLKFGRAINSIHNIPDKTAVFRRHLFGTPIPVVETKSFIRGSSGMAEAPTIVCSP